MFDTLINNSSLIQLIATIVNAIAIVVLVIVTWKYTNATKRMADTMYRQFVYESKPYLSVKYQQKESNGDLVLEFKNNSENSRINVRFDLFLIPPEKAFNRTELQKLEKSKSVLQKGTDIEPGGIYRMNPLAPIESCLEEMGVDTKKDHRYGIAIKGNYTPDIPDIGSFPILKYWHVAKFAEHNIRWIKPIDFN